MSDTPIEKSPQLPIPDGTPLFQVTEADLCELEKTLPQMQDALFAVLARNNGTTYGNRIRMMIRRVQRIIVDIRWNYGPPGEVYEIPAGPDSEVTP